MAVPPVSSSKVLLRSGMIEWRIMAAEPLDRADAGERGDDRLGHARLDQEAGLGDVRVVLGPRLERQVEQRGVELLRRCACQASMAGTRLRVRGET